MKLVYIQNHVHIKILFDISINIHINILSYIFQQLRLMEGNTVISLQDSKGCIMKYLLLKGYQISSFKIHCCGVVQEKD